MVKRNESDNDKSSAELEKLAAESQDSLARELIMFIVENKAWWMVPIIAVMAVVGILVALTATGATPFIYSIF